jgi:hypothetical protein
VVIIVVEVDVLLRGVPRLVGIVAVDHHEERLGRRRQEIRGFREDLRGEPVLLGPSPRSVGRVLAHRASHLRHGPPHLLPIGRPMGPVSVPRLSPDEVEDVEAAVEVVGRLELVQGVGDEHGLITLPLENLRQCGLPNRVRLPPVAPYVIALGSVPVSERPGPEACVDGPPRTDGWQRLGVGIGESQALSGQAVEVGRFDPGIAVGTDVILPQTVHYHHDHVGLGLSVRWTAAPGGDYRGAEQARSSRTRHLQELSSR